MSVAVEQLAGDGELELSVKGLASGNLFPSQVSQGGQRRISFAASGEAHVLRVSLLPGVPSAATRSRAYAASLGRVARSMSPCCVSGAGPGCADPNVLACLCQLDNACCGGPYDATCVAEARGSCGLSCGPAHPANDCCVASGTAGCSEPDVQECVCAIDPFCCAGGYDQNCVNLALHRCGAPCSAAAEAPP